MSSFSPLRFREYARDLSEAIYKMSDHGLRTGIVGSNQFVTLGDRTVMVSQMATDEDLAAAQHLNGATPLPPAPTIQPVKLVDDGPVSNVTGLQSGAFQDAIAAMRRNIANRQKQAVNKINLAVEAGTARMDEAADNIAAKVEKEISAAIQEFAQTSNGGPVE